MGYYRSGFTPFKLPPMTTLLHARSARPGKAAFSLASGTHPKERIGYREWTRRNGRLGDIHSVDNRYDHDVDELLA
jgi:hypothetical protein